MKIIADGLAKTERRNAERKAQVNAERDRRLDLPFEFQGHRYARDAKSLRRMGDAFTRATYAIQNGAAPGDLFWHGEAVEFHWITVDNRRVQMDAQTAADFVSEAIAIESRLIQAARTLKDLAVVPSDCSDDRHWP